MKIKQLRAVSKSGLHLYEICFGNPTLLIGLSGAGKSQILTCLKQIFDLVKGSEKSFLSDGRYEVKFEYDEDEYELEIQIKNDFLSTINLFRHGNLINEPANFLRKLPDVIYLDDVSSFRHSNFIIELISKLTTKQREEIINLYKFIFSSMESIEFEDDVLWFKERHTKSITQKQLSDGMLKTLVYVTYLISCKPGTVLLIDEFENGLGLNCLAVLLDEILNSYELQVILSSHHPYVINNVPQENWRIISRSKDRVIATSAEDFGIGQTRYEAFYELINLLTNGSVED